jgi:hypothetical protein
MHVVLLLLAPHYTAAQCTGQAGNKNWHNAQGKLEIRTGLRLKRHLSMHYCVLPAIVCI